MIATIVVALYIGVMVACWVKVAADYRYNTIRDIGGGTWHSKENRQDTRRWRAFFKSVWALVWPTMVPVWLAMTAFAFAGRLGERRADLEDAAIEALRDEALALKKTRDLFERGSDEWRLLDSVADEARTKWQETQK